jgi:serpin B
MKRLGVVCAAVLLAMSGLALVQGEEPKPDVAVVVKGNNEFALALYDRLRERDGNLFFSPYSISNALAMTAAGARGETLDQMTKTLRLEVDQAKRDLAFQGLIDALNGKPEDRTFQLSVANALWGQKGYHFLPEFLKLTETNYRAGLRQVDFAGDSEKARQTINHWVEEKTQDKIKDLLAPGVIDGATRLVLTNAIYFKAAWARQFSESATTKEDFRLPGEKKIANVPMMHRMLPFTYVDEETFQAIDLPYEGEQLSMVVILPKKVDGLAALEKELSAANLAKWHEKRKTGPVELTLPRFKMTAEFDLNKTLSVMGMPLAFTPKADFSGMTKSESLFISAVVHKAYVDVNEKGTEAAAATAVAVAKAAEPPPPEQPVVFRADHPFVFFIADRATHSILFMGRVTDPLSK